MSYGGRLMGIVTPVPSSSLPLKDGLQIVSYD